MSKILTDFYVFFRFTFQNDSYIRVSYESYRCLVFSYLVDPAGDTFHASSKIIWHRILIKLLPSKNSTGM